MSRSREFEAVRLVGDMDMETGGAMVSEKARQKSGLQYGVSRREFLSTATTMMAAGLLERCARPQPVLGAAEIRLRIAPVEVEIARGCWIKTMAYNDSVPGPVLRVSENKPIRVEIHNGSGVEEYVHWHGLSLEARLDGTEEENSLPVPAHSRLEYILPPQVAGSYYVHTHAMVHRNLNSGVYSGQFAFVYVEPRESAGNYDREIFLASHEWEPYFVDMAQEERTAEQMLHQRMDADDEGAEMGEGGWDVQYRRASLNGKALGHGEPIRVKQGERVLFHFLNASATEEIQLALPGHRFWVQALDGHVVPRPAAVPVLVMGVGERVDAIVEMTSPGLWVLGSTDEEMRGKGLGVVVEYAGRQGEPLWSEPEDTAWDYGFFGCSQMEAAEQGLRLRLARLPLGDDGFERWIIKRSIQRTIETEGQQKDSDSSAALKRGDCYRLSIRNDSGERHPMHLHRYRFELTCFPGGPSNGIVKDTVVVAPYKTADVIVTPRQAGPALFHCHNQMHMDAGLKTLLQVVE
jgi:FtsP/CotA-like multicopper oxidase with cupredoxin domain